jgi:hypothetical protein
MNDAQRYRRNAVECLLAAARRGRAYSGLTLGIAESWLSLARQQKAMDELLVIWSKARAPTSTAAWADGLVRARAGFDPQRMMANRTGMLPQGRTKLMKSRTAAFRIGAARP